MLNGRVFEMKKIISSKGKVWVDKVPDPICGPKDILVQNIASVISSGTEKDSIEVRKGLLKILQRSQERKESSR